MKSAVMMTAAIPMIYLVYPPHIFLEGSAVQLLGWGLLLGILGQVVPTIAFNVGIPRIGSTLAAMLGAMELPVAIIAAFLLIGEPVLLVQWLGMILIIAGILLSEKRSKAKTAV
jgi:drug/metabolite transporter (DMT)-like permease